MNGLSIFFLLCIPVGFVAGFVTRYIYARIKLTSVERDCARTQEQSRLAAEKKANDLLFDAQNRITEERKELERDIRRQNSEFLEEKKRLDSQEDKIKHDQKALEAREESLKNKEDIAEKKIKDLQALEEEQRSKLEQISSLSKEEACNRLMESMSEEAYKRSRTTIKRIENETRNESDKLAAEIILTAMQNTASQVTIDNSSYTFTLPSDDLKGKVIGREGRNIQCLQGATGVEIDIDDTPGVLTISSFDPVRREIARRSLEKLLKITGVNPPKIEQVVASTSKEVDKIIAEYGKKAVDDFNISDISPELINKLGRLHFRTSYGQNVLGHSIETAILAGKIANELRLNSKLALRAGLLHDIGKGIENEGESSHAILGAEVASSLGENEKVVNAIRAHHGDCKPESLEAIIVQIADAISASRPGARRDSHDIYIKRLGEIEDIALSFEGVSRAFVTQAGRDLRVIVDNTTVSDEKCEKIAHSICDRISAETKVPGAVKVTVIRESRFVECSN